jgi:hypothetical protein
MESEMKIEQFTITELGGRQYRRKFGNSHEISVLMMVSLKFSFLVCDAA